MTRKCDLTSLLAIKNHSYGDSSTTALIAITAISALEIIASAKSGEYIKSIADVAISNIQTFLNRLDKRTHDSRIDPFSYKEEHGHS